MYMKTIFLFLALIPIISSGQNNANPQKTPLQGSRYVKSVDHLTLEGAFELTRLALESAAELNKNVSIAVLDANGITILLVRGENVGPHNTEASRRKAYTALSTKTSSFELMQKASADPTAINLNSIPELLLLGGGIPIWKNSELIGSLGVSGAGGGWNDHNVAKQAVEKLGFSINKLNN